MMPRLDGLALVAALRADPRTAAVPVLLLSARAGQEASIEGLQAGADDYLVKPFAAAELLARVRANVELARLRNHHARWRTALVDSLQEAFFVCDEHGAVIEINTAFTDILGYGPEGLPYEPIAPVVARRRHRPRGAPAGRGRVRAAARATRTAPTRFPSPTATATGCGSTSPSTTPTIPTPAARVMVGTFRDVTAEHYAVQRQTALAALNQRLAQADTVDEALRRRAEELQQAVAGADAFWPCTVPGVRAASAADSPRSCASASPSRWADLPADDARGASTALRDGDLLIPDADRTRLGGHRPAASRAACWSLWVELAEQRPFTARGPDPADRAGRTPRPGPAARAPDRPAARDRPRRCSTPSSGPPICPSGFAVRYQPASRARCRSAATGTTSSTSTTAASALDRRRLRRPRPGRGRRHGSAAQRLPRAAARAPQSRRRADGPGPLRRAAARRARAPPPSARCSTPTPASWSTPAPAIRRRILVHADGTHATARRRPGHAAGRCDRTATRPEARVTMPPRATLLLYTDGLVERRRQLARRRHRPRRRPRPGRPCRRARRPGDEIMSQLAPGGGYQDDVALLLYRQPGPLEMDFPADVGQLAATRTRAARLADAAPSVRPGQTQDVLIAAGEACRQRHRARPPATARRHGQPARDRIGRPRAPDRHRHRRLEDPATGAPTSSRPRHDADAGSDAGRHHPPGRRRHHRPHVREDRLMTTPLTITADRRDGGTLALVAAGEIDLSNVDAFAVASTTPSPRAAARPLTVDLSAVDYLDSGGHQRAVHLRRPHPPDRQPASDARLTISGLTELATVEPAPRAADR